MTKIPKTIHPKSNKAQNLAAEFLDVFPCPHCGAINYDTTGLVKTTCVSCSKEILEKKRFGIADKLSVHFIKQNTPEILQYIYRWLKGKSIHTLRPYLSRMKCFVKYCADNELDPLKIDVEEIKDYYEMRSKIVSPVSAFEEVYTTLKSFYSFLYEQNIIMFHPVKDKTIQVPQEDGSYRQKTISATPDKAGKTPSNRSREAIPAPSFSLALEFAMTPIVEYTWQGDPKDFPKEVMYNLRDGVMMTLLLALGLRRKDPTLLSWDDIYLDDALIYFKGRKNERTTWMPIPKFALPFLDYYYLAVLRRRAWRNNEKAFMISSNRGITKRIKRHYFKWHSLKFYNDLEIKKLQTADFRKKLLLQQNASFFDKSIPVVFRRGSEKFEVLKPHGIFRKTWFTFVGLHLNDIVRNYLFGHSTKGALNDLVSVYAGIREFVLSELTPEINQIWDRLNKDFPANIYVARENIIRQVKLLRAGLNLEHFDYDARYFTEKSSKICSKCGALININDKFCPNCGQTQVSNIVQIE